ncbi:MAG: hypothetical protein N3E50_01160 [Candidatus Goldbacteria bacterium]|nr:hypothetical protein [Candidatus Goldiibacteriota bacterium]
MKRKLIFLMIIVFFMNFLFAATMKKKIKEEKIEKIEIKNAQDIVEYLKRQGFSGSEINEGIIAKTFKLISLRDYRGFYNGDKYSIAIWDFEKSSGFNMAIALFQMLTLLTDTVVYKDRPYIISIEGNETEQKKNN